MSEVQSIPAPAAAPKLNAIQIIEAEIQGFLQQAERAKQMAEQAVANVHAVQGAIQGAQQLLAKLKAAAAEAEKLATPTPVLTPAGPEATLDNPTVEPVEQTKDNVVSIDSVQKS